MQRTMKAALLSRLCPQCPPCRVQACTHTFRRAWQLRSSELHVLAHRADCRCLASRKKLVLVDTTLFADIKEPKSAIEDGEQVRELLMSFYTTRLRRSPPAHGVRTILAFLDKPCRWHDEQCTVAEFAAYIARDVLAHLDLAAEARVKVPVKSQNDEESELESDDDEKPRRARAELEFVDMGGGDDANVDADMADVPVGQVSRFPLRDVKTAISLCFQHPALDALDTKKAQEPSRLGHENSG